VRLTQNSTSYCESFQNRLSNAMRCRAGKTALATGSGALELKRVKRSPPAISAIGNTICTAGFPAAAVASEEKGTQPVEAPGGRGDVAL
jgi:hypothetical protein